MIINLHIENLRFQNISIESSERTPVQAAFASELTDLLLAKGTAQELRSTSNTHVIDGGTIAVGVRNKPSYLGKQIAGAVYGSLVK